MNSSVQQLSFKSAVAFTVSVWLSYLVIMFVFPDIMPERFSWDSNRLMSLAETGGEADAAYGTTAFIFSLVPESLLMPTIAGLGTLFIFWLCGTAATLRTQVVTAVLAVPILAQCLMRPQKEVIVVALSMAALYALSKLKRQWLAVGIVVALYLAYGLYVRHYYVLIAAAFVYSIVFAKSGGGIRVLLVIAVAICLLMTPEAVYYDIQGSRDSVNAMRVLGEEGQRTLFNNPWPTDGTIHFLLNYVYAFIRLNLAALFLHKPADFFLTATTIIYAWLLRTGLKGTEPWVKNASLLFLAHILVLTLFEPDFGSYLRHSASVAIYLWPALLLSQLHHYRAPDAHPFLPFVRLPQPKPEAGVPS